MRISDWSSDVCSSDLIRRFGHQPPPEPSGLGGQPGKTRMVIEVPLVRSTRMRVLVSGTSTPAPGSAGSTYSRLSSNSGWGSWARTWLRCPFRCSENVLARSSENGASYTWIRDRHGTPRSEEHTSELQSLMRISYAVFCLKKKQITTSHPQYN